ncbi:MAG: hypothetical protein IPO19_18200 [Rhodoferax sp.]|nr:hypothetical protein [Rhodoferax sp.]
MKYPHTGALLAMTCGATLMLSACGGGSGGTETTVPPAASALISSANAQEANAHGYSAAEALSGRAGSSSDFVTGVAITKPTEGLIGLSLQQLYRAVESRAAPGLVVGVTTSRSMPCPLGGSTSLTLNLASGLVISAGDNLSIAASNCKMDTTTTLNGTMTLAIIALSGLPTPTSAWSATLGATFTGFSETTGTQTSTANGDMTVKMTQVNAQDLSIAATGTTLRMGTSKNGVSSEVTMKNYSYTGSVKGDVVSYGVNFSMSGNLPKLGSVDYSVKTTTNFTQTTTALYPSQGVMTVTAADKTSTTLTVIDSGNVSVGVDKNGDGSVDETLTTTWAALMARI